MELSKKEKSLLLEVINHAIAYRLNEKTRLSDVSDLKSIKKKIENINQKKEE